MGHEYNPTKEIGYLNSLESQYRADAAAWEMVMFQLEHIDRMPILAYELELLPSGEIGKDGKSIREMTDPTEAGGANTILSITKISEMFRSNPEIKTAMYLSPDIGYGRDYLYVFEQQKNGKISARAFEYRGDEESRTTFHQLVGRESHSTASNDYFQPMFSSERIQTSTLASLAEQSYGNSYQREMFKEYRSRLVAATIREQFISVDQRKLVDAMRQELERSIESVSSWEERDSRLYYEIYKWANRDSVRSAPGLKQADTENSYQPIKQYKKTESVPDQNQKGYYATKADDIGLPFSGASSKQEEFLTGRFKQLQSQRNTQGSVASGRYRKRELDFLPLDEFIEKRVIKKDSYLNQDVSSDNMFARFMRKLQERKEHKVKPLTEIGMPVPLLSLPISTSTHNTETRVATKKDFLPFEQAAEMIHLPEVDRHRVLTSSELLVLLSYLSNFLEDSKSRSHNDLKENGVLKNVISLLTQRMDAVSKRVSTSVDLLSLMSEDFEGISVFFLSFLKQVLSQNVIGTKKEEQLSVKEKEKEIHQRVQLSLEQILLFLSIAESIPNPLSVESLTYSSFIEKPDSDYLEQFALLQLQVLYSLVSLLEELEFVGKKSKGKNQDSRLPLLLSIILYLSKIKDQGRNPASFGKKSKKKQQLTIPLTATVYSFAA